MQRVYVYIYIYIYNCTFNFIYHRIDARFIIKVADFGLAENIYSKTYFRQEKDKTVKLPVKWLALEALTEGLFSEKTDVVSCATDKWCVIRVSHCLHVVVL